MGKHKAIVILIPYKIDNGGVRIWTQIRESSDGLTGLLEFPGGKVELHETFEEAIIREVYEETKVSIEKRELSHFADYEFAPLVITAFLFHDQNHRFKIQNYRPLGDFLDNPNLMLPNNEVILKNLDKRFQ